MRSNPIIMMLLIFLAFLMINIIGDFIGGIILMLTIIGITLVGCQAYLHDIREALENVKTND